jgi:hypothetical protein
MDSKRAELLMNVARKEQHKAYLRWTSPSSRSRDERFRELARLDCAAWATCADELYRIVERHHQGSQA